MHFFRRSPDNASREEIVGQGPDITIQLKAERIIQKLLKTHVLLRELPDLHPGDDVNGILSGLVSLCSQIHDREVIKLVGLPNTRINWLDSKL